MANPLSGSKISIVVPVFNEAAMITLLLERLAATARQLDRYTWELVLVDDGSTDDSAQRILDQAGLFPGKLLLRRFSRNFGHQAALMAGLEKASGDAIIFIDADLQDPPDLFTTFLDHFEKGYDVVYGVRKRRQAGFVMNLAYKLFYLLFQKMADVAIPLDAGDFGLISRRAAQVIRQMPERDLLLRGLRSWVGFKQIGIPYDRPERHAGESKYTLRKLMRLASSAFFGYSSLPLRVATACGFGSVLLALFYGGYALYGKLVLDSNPPGWTSLVMVILLLSGAQLISVGILGEYIARIYQQTLNRPLYVVADDHGE